MLFYEKIAAFGKAHLLPNGRIYLETHEDLAKDVASLFVKDYQTVMIKRDMSGKERMVLVTAILAASFAFGSFAASMMRECLSIIRGGINIHDNGGGIHEFPVLIHFFLISESM